jgi:N-formylglutamate amidohydrolase
MDEELEAKPETADSCAVPFARALQIAAPKRQTMPVVLASPHSGRDYPAEFLAQSALDARGLRRSEDSFIDELFGSAPERGAPLLAALFPRAYLDVNREAYELDPAMFEGTLPPFVMTDTPRVAAGLGTIARQVANGAEIYRRKLTFAEAERRVRSLYLPYHMALGDLITQTLASFSRCVLLDCHSMPSIGGPHDTDSGTERVDFVLGDCYGRSCAPQLTSWIEHYLAGLGYCVVRNSPYAGGYTTRHYGNPAVGVHALQIEINRRLYMDESTHQKSEGFAPLQGQISALLGHLADFLKKDSLK